MRPIAAGQDGGESSACEIPSGSGGVLAPAVPSSEDDARGVDARRTLPGVSRRRASLGDARRGARESRVRREAPIGMRTTHSTRVPDSDVQLRLMETALRQQQRSCPVDKRRL
mmetsp:Transcript_5756/g.21781  ORF Transcript_5756/g.21781 Transcript_5756/m.21781 type:complete len:113 (-) Transcript_5756:10-348(-)